MKENGLYVVLIGENKRMSPMFSTVSALFSTSSCLWVRNLGSGRFSFLSQLQSRHLSLSHLCKQTYLWQLHRHLNGPIWQTIFERLGRASEKVQQREMQQGTASLSGDYSFRTVCEVLPDLDDLQHKNSNLPA